LSKKRKKDETMQAVKATPHIFFFSLQEEWECNRYPSNWTPFVPPFSVQSMVAEKDAELAHTYKLLEASASERSRLRTEHQAAQERMRELQVRLRALTSVCMQCVSYDAQRSKRREQMRWLWATSSEDRSFSSWVQGCRARECWKTVVGLMKWTASEFSG
jgi:hypothetical protein